MGVIVRCSSFATATATALCSHPSPQADQISGEFHLPWKGASLLCKVKKCQSSYRDSGGTPVRFQQLFQGNKGAKPMVFYQKFNENWVIGYVPAQCNKLSKCFPGLEEKLKLKLPGMAVLAANALIWSSPLEARAEVCEADNSFFNMPLLLLVALIGATVGGLLARQRRGELKRLNEQLRQINAALRRQAKIESYAPTLSYAPVGGRIPDNEVIVDPRKQELISCLKTGKNFLRNQEPEKAFSEFNTALELARSVNDPIEEKKAARGLGAAMQRQGKYREAIKYHSMVLAISEREGEESGNTEAYGAIADCYTELGDLEKAGKFYDKYIARLETD